MASTKSILTSIHGRRFGLSKDGKAVVDGKVVCVYDDNGVERRKQVAPQTVNATATMTATNILARIVTSTTAATVAATLPLATDLDTALPDIAIDEAFEFVVINTGGNAFTVTTNTGWTLVGAMAVAAGTSGRFEVRKTAAGAYTCYRV